MIQDESLNNTRTKFFLTWGSKTKELQLSTIEYLDGISGSKITKPLIPLLQGFYMECEDKSKITTLIEKWKKDAPEIADKLDEILKEN